ncbi:MAG: hypothetical protein ACI8PZ_005036, partial [Myxococcota bacterium]
CHVSADNAVRVHCDAEGPATVVLSAPGLPTRQATGEPPVVWGLRADTRYSWTLGERSGVVTTGSLPPALAAAELTATGSLPADVDAVLLALACEGPALVMVDGDGAIVWYDQDTPFASPRHGYSWSQEDGTVWSLNDTTLVGVAAAGGEVLRLEQGVHFTGTLHHDLTRWGPYTYVLFSEPHPVADMDGIHVFEGTTLVASWRLSDSFEVVPADPPIIGAGAGDWAHANGLTATPDGELVLSLLNFDTVIGLGGDPSLPDLLSPRWLAVGSERGLPGADFVPADPMDGFRAQHNASRQGEALWLFDNTGTGDGSRAVRFGMADGQLTREAAWDLGIGCPVQSGAVPLAHGVLASCATAGSVYVFPEGSSAPAWSLQTRCGESFRSTMTRAHPVQFR